MSLAVHTTCGKSADHLIKPDSAFLRVLREVSEELDAVGFRYGIFGGVASSALGRPRTTRDIDLLVHPDAADAVLQFLSTQGYETDRLDEKWIFKAYKHGISVDLIFSTRYGVYLDQQMLEHVCETSYEGVPIRTIGPEDLLIIKAIACDEATPKHWYDALGLIIGCELDWDYLVTRAKRGQRRVLSLLLYAQSIDYFIPERAIRSLMLEIVEGARDAAQ